jgi:hypothetical protein
MKTNIQEPKETVKSHQKMEVSKTVRLDDETKSYLREMFLPAGYKEKKEIVLNYNRIKTDLNQCNFIKEASKDVILKKIEKFEIKDIATNKGERLFVRHYIDFSIKFCLNKTIWTSYIITKNIKNLKFYENNFDENNFVIKDIQNGNRIEYLILLEIEVLLRILEIKI